MNRRKLLATSFVLIVSGCSSVSDRLTQPESNSTAAQSTDAERLLPEENQNWTRQSVQKYEWSYLGGNGGIMSEYKHQAGDIHTVLIFEEESQSRAETRAETFICAGWPVAIYLENFALAAGTGTYNATLTPEEPPHLTETPIPETKDDSESLLLQSPGITEMTLENNSVSECG